jgi:hypothetical protein
MSYFYFKPGNPQYFFPENFKDHPFFLSFFQPYTQKAKVVWWLWQNFSSFRKLFVIENIEKYIPESLIRSELVGNPILAFNMGSPGPEQKITALGFQNNSLFFLKFGQGDIARINVLNEAKILNQLEHLDFVPRVLEVIENKEFTLLKTTVLTAARFAEIRLNEEVVTNLIRINTFQVETRVNFNNSTRTVFSHGDYCPWNLLILDGDLKVFDWEMAGNYPLGYDLFTFIFQTSFLLYPKITINQLITENDHFIAIYFTAFNIKDWKQYLVDFALIKYQLESKKNNVRLIPKYKDLLLYAQKA